jgi:hypothetical protein
MENDFVNHVIRNLDPGNILLIVRYRQKPYPMTQELDKMGQSYAMVCRPPNQAVDGRITVAHVPK